MEPARPAASSLQPDGSLRLALQGTLPGGFKEGRLSAPLLPDMVVFQHLEGDGYPGSAPEREAIADRSVYHFGFLLQACHAKYPAIKLPMPPAELSRAELATNFNEVARCGYYEYGTKPYWVPQFMNDVDLCARKLGPGWRLPTPEDVAALQEADFVTLRDTLTGAAQPDPLNGTAKSWGTFYYSLKMYLRGADGALLLGDLNPGASQRTRPLGRSGAQLKELIIDDQGDNTALRCIRGEG